ncbi:TadE family protein [Aquihabitans daechungensis]|uniref:TadE family protein n=1 Tax=Aquihabitans daechungensis TaxID=1052257 RepID=UPI003B9F8B94
MAIVEAAFVTPVFFAMILGIFEAGLYMKDYLAMSNAVRAEPGPRVRRARTARPTCTPSSTSPTRPQRSRPTRSTTW